MLSRLITLLITVSVVLLYVTYYYRTTNYNAAFQYFLFSGLYGWCL